MVVFFFIRSVSWKKHTVYLFLLSTLGVVLKNDWNYCIPENRNNWDGQKARTAWKLEQPESWNNLEAGTTWNLEQPEIWNDLKAGNNLKALTTWKLEQPESWNEMKAGKTWKLEQAESWNNLKAGTTGTTAYRPPASISLHTNRYRYWLIWGSFLKD